MTSYPLLQFVQYRNVVIFFTYLYGFVFTKILRTSSGTNSQVR